MARSINVFMGANIYGDFRKGSELRGGGVAGILAPMLTKEEVLKIGRLARLELTADEVEFFQSRLTRVLGYVSELDKVATDTDAFVRHVPKDAVSVREDKSVSFQSIPAILKNAPDIEENSFRLPAVLEE